MNKKLVYMFAVIVAGLFVISACSQDAVGARAINRNIVGDGGGENEITQYFRNIRADNFRLGRVNDNLYAIDTIRDDQNGNLKFRSNVDAVFKERVDVEKIVAENFELGILPNNNLRVIDMVDENNGIIWFRVNTNAALKNDVSINGNLNVGSLSELHVELPEGENAYVCVDQDGNLFRSNRACR